MRYEPQRDSDLKQLMVPEDIHLMVTAVLHLKTAKDIINDS